MTDILRETFISKYKPYFITDFCMTTKMRNVIRTLLEIDDLNLLFVGPTGCGKTSLLYAIIREYYGLSKTANIPETNILFINTLKEQGINYFRNEMKTFCQSKCSIYGKKKMIVIDDLDTINEQGQQVFRNYIDKYHHNIHFVSVCTNLQKVIESIQSRIHILQMQSPSKEDISNIYEKITSEEGIEIDEDAKEYILQICADSVRLLVNYLEKFYIYGKRIDIDTCRKMCANISNSQFEEYLKYAKENNVKDAILLLYGIHDFGYSVIDILDYFFGYIKQTTILSDDEKYLIIPLLCKYITIFNKIHEDGIELAIFTNELCKHLFKG